MTRHLDLWYYSFALTNTVMRERLSDITLQRVALFSVGVGYCAVALLSLMPAAYRPHIIVVGDHTRGSLCSVAFRLSHPGDGGRSLVTQT